MDDDAQGWALLCLAQVRTTINTCRTKHRSVSPQDGFNYSTTRLMAKANSGFRVQGSDGAQPASMRLWKAAVYSWKDFGAAHDLLGVTICGVVPPCDLSHVGPCH